MLVCKSAVWSSRQTVGLEASILAIEGNLLLEIRILHWPEGLLEMMRRRLMISSCLSRGHPSRPSTITRIELKDSRRRLRSSCKIFLEGLRPLSAQVSRMNGASSVFAVRSWVANVRRTSVASFGMCDHADRRRKGGLKPCRAACASALCVR